MKMEEKEPIKRTAKVGNSLLVNLIKNQGSTLFVAALEQLQNAVDSKANFISISVYNDLLVFQDNGKGINIDFELIGESFKINEKNSLGMYGTGRVKILNYGVADWKTYYKGNKTRYCWDFRKDELEFQEFPDFEATESFTKGTMVILRLYPDMRLASSELEHLIFGIKSNIRAISHIFNVKIELNGKLVESDSDYKRFESANSVILLKDGTSGVGMFNRGLYVCSYYDNVVSGMVISKNNLRVTNERNALISNVKYNTTVKLEMNNRVFDYLIGLNQNSSAQKSFLVGAFINNPKMIDRIPDRKIFVTSGNSYVSYNELKKSKIVFLSQGDPLAQEAIPLGIICLKEKWQLENLFGDNLEVDLLSFTEFSNLIAESGSEKNLVITYETLKKKYGVKVRKLFCLSCVINNTLFNRDRDLKPGVGHALGWTDGADYICINIDKLAAQKTQSAAIPWIVELLVHEYTHDVDSNGSCDHGTDFDREYRSNNINKLSMFSKLLERFYRRTGDTIASEISNLMSMLGLE
jgi:hypothetical protein